MSGCFVALVGALRALGGEITPPRYGWVYMMKKDVAGLGICGCMTSPLWLETWYGKCVILRGISGCFGTLVGAQRALDGEITSPRCGWVFMMKKNVSGVGICGCLTSLVWKHNRENGSFWGVCLAVLGLWWGPRGPWMGKSPLPDVDEYVEEKCCWCGYLWLHDITLIVWKHDRENGSFWGVCLAVWGLWLGPLRALDGQITPARCGWVS